MQITHAEVDRALKSAEKQAWGDWLVENEFLASGQSCPQQSCGAELQLQRDSRSVDGLVYRCSSQRCRRRYSCRYGSRFKDGGHASIAIQLRDMVEFWGGVSARTALGLSACSGRQP